MSLMKREIKCKAEDYGVVVVHLEALGNKQSFQLPNVCFSHPLLPVLWFLIFSVLSHLGVSQLPPPLHPHLHPPHPPSLFKKMKKNQKTHHHHHHRRHRRRRRQAANKRNCIGLISMNAMRTLIALVKNKEEEERSTEKGEEKREEKKDNTRTDK
jgi:hypothetical protein